MKKVTHWKWTAQKDQAFEELKISITEAPVLNYPDFLRVHSFNRRKQLRPRGRLNAEYRWTKK